VLCATCVNINVLRNKSSLNVRPEKNSNVSKLEARMKFKKMLDIHNLSLVLIKIHIAIIDISCCNKICLLLPPLPLEIRCHISKCVHDKTEQAFNCWIRNKAKGKVHPATCHEGSDKELVVNAMPQTLYPWEWPGTHCRGDCMGPRAGRHMSRCRKSRSHPQKKFIP
jgi:hypothetical protein